MALIYCPECGKQVSESASVCPNCGYPISKLNLSGKKTEELGANIEYDMPADGYYNVFLSSALSGGVTSTAQVLSDILGYSFSDALSIATNLPTIVLYNVTKEQAFAAANALTDYGLDVSVYNKEGYVDFSEMTYSSEDYTSVGSGSSVASTLRTILLTLTVNNLIRRRYIRRRSFPFLYSMRPPIPRRQTFFYTGRRYNNYRMPGFRESLIGLYGHSSGLMGRGGYPGGPAGGRSGGNGYPGSYGNGRPGGYGNNRPGGYGNNQPGGNGNNRPGGNGGQAGKPRNGGSLFGGLFGGGSSGTSHVGGFGGNNKSGGSGHSSSQTRGSGFGGSGIGGSYKPSGMSHGSGSTRGSFGGASGLGHSSSRSAGSSFGGGRSSGSSFGGGHASGGGSRVGGGAKGGMGHGKN